MCTVTELDDIKHDSPWRHMNDSCNKLSLICYTQGGQQNTFNEQFSVFKETAVSRLFLLFACEDFSQAVTIIPFTQEHF